MTYELTGQTSSLAGRPDAVFRIRAARDGLTGKPDHIYISQMGPWRFFETNYGFQGSFETATGKLIKILGWVDNIDFRKDGPHDAMLPVEVNEINDVVAHYDELVRYFATRPDGQTWGEAKSTGHDRLMYCVRPVGQPRPQDPANFP